MSLTPAAYCVSESLLTGTPMYARHNLARSKPRLALAAATISFRMRHLVRLTLLLTCGMFARAGEHKVHVMISPNVVMRGLDGNYITGPYVSTHSADDEWGGLYFAPRFPQVPEVGGQVVKYGVSRDC